MCHFMALTIEDVLCTSTWRAHFGNCFFSEQFFSPKTTPLWRPMAVSSNLSKEALHHPRNLRCSRAPCAVSKGGHWCRSDTPKWAKGSHLGKHIWQPIWPLQHKIAKVPSYQKALDTPGSFWGFPCCPESACDHLWHTAWWYRSGKRAICSVSYKQHAFKLLHGIPGDDCNITVL